MVRRFPFVSEHVAQTPCHYFFLKVSSWVAQDCVYQWVLRKMPKFPYDHKPTFVRRTFFVKLGSKVAFLSVKLCALVRLGIVLRVSLFLFDMREYAEE